MAHWSRLFLQQCGHHRQRLGRPVEPPRMELPRARRQSMADLVFVLAVGRLEEARMMLVEVETDHADPGLDSRFARQVRRRQGSGTREVPPGGDPAAAGRASSVRVTLSSTNRAQGSATRQPGVEWARAGRPGGGIVRRGSGGRRPARPLRQPPGTSTARPGRLSDPLPRRVGNPNRTPQGRHRMQRASC